MSVNIAVPKILKNFNLFIGGVGYAGIVEELNLPKLALKTEEHRAGGMDLPIDLDLGMEKITCEFTLSEYKPDVLQSLGVYTDPTVMMNFKGALSDEQGVVPVNVEIHGTWREMEMGSWKAGDKATLKVSVTARYYALSYDKNEIIKIDTENMVRMIGGVDQLEKVREAIGL